ncbi:unnamed protein product, partial [Closterium sp. Naga37s-1]
MRLWLVAVLATIPLRRSSLLILAIPPHIPPYNAMRPALSPCPFPALSPPPVCGQQRGIAGLGEFRLPTLLSGLHCLCDPLHHSRSSLPFSSTPIPPLSRPPLLTALTALSTSLPALCVPPGGVSSGQVRAVHAVRARGRQGRRLAQRTRQGGRYQLQQGAGRVHAGADQALLSSYASLLSAPSSYASLLSAPSSYASLLSAPSSYASLLSALSSYASLLSAPSSYASLLSALSSYASLLSAPSSYASLLSAPSSYASLLSAPSSYASLLSAPSSYASLLSAPSSYASLLSAPSSYASLLSAPSSYASLLSAPSSYASLLSAPSSYASLLSAPSSSINLTPLFASVSLPVFRYELPAFRLYPWEVKANPYTHKRYKDAPQVFTGDNTAKALVSFATAALPHDLVANISSGASADAFLSANATLNKVVLFSTKPAVTPLFKALSLQFRNRLVFAQAKSTDEDLAASFGATSFPALFLHKPDGTRQLYEGPLKPEPIAAFLEQFAAPAEPAADSATAGEAEAGAAGEERQSRWVRQMRAANVSSQVLQREEMWMVALTSSSEECREVKEKFEKTAEELVGMIFVGVVDMHTDEDANSLATKYGVKEPCGEALLFPLGDDKEENEPDRMPLTASLKAMTAAVYALAPDSFVRHITADSLEVFAQTNPLQPKVFLFTNKRETPGMYKVLSTTFRKDASFALVHESEKKVVARFKVAKFPHMSIMFPAPSPGREGEVQLTVRDFPGPLKYHTVAPQLMQLVATARQFAAPTAEIVALGEGKEGQEDAFQTECVDSNRLCVIGIFSTDSPLDQLKRVAAKWLRGGQFVFMWLDAGRHKALASRVLPLLGVNQQDLPTAVVVSPRKMRCAVLPESFSPPILDAFLDSLLAGRVRTFALDRLPSFLPGPSEDSSPASEAAEEAAEPEPIAEEEFDLADIMSEQVEDADAVASKEHKILQADKEAEEEAARKAAEAEAAKKASKKKKKKSKTKKSKAVDSDVRDELLSRHSASLAANGAVACSNHAPSPIPPSWCGSDASIWLVQFLKAMRDDRGELLPGAHLLGFLRRVCKLLFLRIRPLIVFDGATPALKRRTVLARHRQRENAQINLRRTAEKLLLNQLRLRKLEEAAQEMQQRGRGRAVGRGTGGARGGGKGKEKVDEVVGDKKQEDEGRGRRCPEDKAAQEQGGCNEEARRDQEHADALLAASLAAEWAGQSAGTSGAAPDVAGTSRDAAAAAAAAAAVASVAAATAGGAGGGEAARGPVEVEGGDGGSDEGSDEDDLTEEAMALLPEVASGGGAPLDPAVLASLPPSLQLQLMVQLVAENRHKFEQAAKAPAAFSSLQVGAYLRTAAMRRQIDSVRSAAASAFAASAPAAVAAATFPTSTPGSSSAAAAVAAVGASGGEVIGVGVAGRAGGAAEAEEGVGVGRGGGGGVGGGRIASEAGREFVFTSSVGQGAGDAPLGRRLPPLSAAPAQGRGGKGLRGRGRGKGAWGHRWTGEDAWGERRGGGGSGKAKQVEGDKDKEGAEDECERDGLRDFSWGGGRGQGGAEGLLQLPGILQQAVSWGRGRRRGEPGGQSGEGAREAKGGGTGGAGDGACGVSGGVETRVEGGEEEGEAVKEAYLALVAEEGTGQPTQTSGSAVNTDAAPGSAARDAPPLGGSGSNAAAGSPAADNAADGDDTEAADTAEGEATGGTVGEAAAGATEGGSVPTYRDEQGRVRVSRVRGMGVRMTRDLQWNLVLMREREKERATGTGNGGKEEKGRDIGREMLKGRDIGREMLKGSEGVVGKGEEREGGEEEEVQWEDGMVAAAADDDAGGRGGGATGGVCGMESKGVDEGHKKEKGRGLEEGGGVEEEEQEEGEGGEYEDELFAMLVAAGKVRTTNPTHTPSTLGGVAAPSTPLALTQPPAAISATGHVRHSDAEERREEEEDVEWEDGGGGEEEVAQSLKGEVEGGEGREGGFAAEKDVQGRVSPGDADVDMEADVEWEEAPVTVQHMKPSKAPPSPQPGPPSDPAPTPASASTSAALSTPTRADERGTASLSGAKRRAGAWEEEQMAEAELLQQCGVPYIIAPMEAEAPCAWLAQHGVVDAVVSDDCDALLFGAPTLWRHLFSDRHYVEVYRAEDVQRELGLSRRHLVRMAMLLGCDYTPGISGIGVVNAIEVIHAFPGARGLQRFRHWLDSPHAAALAHLLPGGAEGGAAGGAVAAADGWGDDDGWWEDEESDEEEEGEEGGEEEVREARRALAEARRREFEATHAGVRRQWVVPGNFPSAAVAAAFNRPHVDRSTAPPSWHPPDLPALRQLCVAKLGMAPEKADALLLPVVKAASSRQTQQRLEAFYSFKQRFAKIRSRRVQRAVTGIAGSAARHLMLPPSGVTAPEEDDAEEEDILDAHAPTANAAGAAGAKDVSGGREQDGVAAGGGGGGVVTGVRRGKAKGAAGAVGAAEQSTDAGSTRGAEGGMEGGVAERGGTGVPVRVQPRREAKRPRLQLGDSYGALGGDGVDGVSLSDSHSSSSGSDADLADAHGDSNGGDDVFHPQEHLPSPFAARPVARRTSPTGTGTCTGQSCQQQAGGQGGVEGVGGGEGGGKGDAAGQAGGRGESEGTWVVQRHAHGAEEQQHGCPRHGAEEQQHGWGQGGAPCSSLHALMHGGGFCVGEEQHGEGQVAEVGGRERGEEEQQLWMEQTGGAESEEIRGVVASNEVTGGWGGCREMGEKVFGGTEGVDGKRESEGDGGGMVDVPTSHSSQSPTLASLEPAASAPAAPPAPPAPPAPDPHRAAMGPLLPAPLRRKKPRVEGRVVAEIGAGLCVLVGVMAGDGEQDCDYMCRKILNLRLWPNEKTGKAWDQSVSQRGYEVLLVSQFTLYGQPKGNKLDFHVAMPPQEASAFYDAFVHRVRRAYHPDRVKDGIFGAMME